MRHPFHNYGKSYQDELVIKLREQRKLTFREIGEKLGISRDACARHYTNAVGRRIYRLHFPQETALSVRTANVMSNALGFYCEHITKYKPQLIELYKQGKFGPGKNSTRNCGWKTYVEISKFLGFPEPVKTQIQHKRCPHCGHVI